MWEQEHVIETWVIRDGVLHKVYASVIVSWTDKDRKEEPEEVEE